MENENEEKDIVVKIDNSMTTTEKTYSVVWRPNNYRRQIQVKSKNNSAILPLLTTIGIIPTDARVNFNTHTKILSIKEFKPNITIQYSNTTLTAIYSQDRIDNKKIHYLIEADLEIDLDTRIDQLKEQIQARMDAALNEFIDKANIRIPNANPIWSRSENLVKGIDYIDQIPKNCIIHDTYFKKVYEVGIETITGKDIDPTATLKNVIKNRVLENYLPEIKGRLDKQEAILSIILEANKSTSQAFNSFATGFLPAFSEFHRDIQVHNRAIKELAKGIGTLNKKINTIKEKQTKLNI